MSGSIHTRVAVHGDADRIADFNVRLARETEGITLESARAIEGSRTILADARLGRYFIAERDGAVCGQALVTFEPSDWQGGTYWWVQSVYVEPSARVTGVFRALWDRIIEDAGVEGDVRGVRLYVHGDNRRAQEVYQAMRLTPSPYRIFEYPLP